MSTINNGGTLAIKGYDPVAYFSGNSVPGDAVIASEHGSSKYYFSSEANKSTFDSNPDKYIPQYGGFCATAMSEGKLFDVDPTNFKIVDDKLLLFYNGSGGNTKTQWEEDSKTRLKNANEHWNSGDYK